MRWVCLKRYSDVSALKQKVIKEKSKVLLKMTAEVLKDQSLSMKSEPVDVKERGKS